MCKPENLTEDKVRNSIDNGESFFEIDKNEKVQAILNRLSFTQGSSKLDESTHKYSIFGIDIDKSVTEKYIKPLRQRMFGESEFTEYTQIPADAGTFLHSILERIGKVRTEQNENDPDWGTFTLEDVKSNALSGDKNGDFSLLDYEFDALVSIIDGLLEDIKSKQEEINQSDNAEVDKGDVKIIWEQRVADPINNVMGTIDVLAVFSDKTAVIYDFKSFTVPSSKRDMHGYLDSDMYFSKNKQKEHKIQLKEYAKILENIYGVKRVVGGRIVPIHFEFQWKKNEKNELEYDEDGYPIRSREFSLIETSVAGSETENNALYNISRLFEHSNLYGSLDELLDKLYAREQRIKNRMKTDRINRQSYEEELFETNKNISALTQKNDLKALWSIIRRTINFTRDSLSDLALAETEEELSRNLNLLRLYKRDIASFMNLDKDLKPFLDYLIKIGDTEKKNEIVEEAQILHKELSVLYTHISSEITDYVLNDLKWRNVIDDTDFEGGQLQIMEEHGLNYNFGISQDFDNPLIRYLQERKQEIFDKSQRDLKQFVTDSNVAEARALSKVSRKELERLMINKETLNINSRIDYEKINKERKEAFDAIDADEKIEDKDKVKEKAKWMMEHYIPRKNYVENFERAIEKYERRLESRFADITNETTREEVIVSELEKFEAKNNLELDSDGNPLYPSAWLNRRNLKFNPELYEQYETEAYKEIKKIPEVQEYWKMYTDYMSEALEMLGISNERRELNETFLPYIRRDLIDRMHDNDFMEAGDFQKLSSIAGEIFNMRAREDSAMYGIYHEGKLVEEIPIFWTNPFREYNESGDFDILKKEKSLDMRRSLQLFYNMAVANQYKLMSEPFVASLSDVLHETNKVKLLDYNAEGQIFKSFTDKLVNKMSSGSDLESYIDSMLRMYWYGQHIQSKDTIIGNGISVNEVLRKAKRYDLLRSLGLSFIPATGSYIAARGGLWIEGEKGLAFNNEQLKKALLNGGIGINKIRRSLSNQGLEREKYLAFSYFLDISTDDILERLNKENPQTFDQQFKDIFRDANYNSPDSRSKLKAYVNERTFMSPWSLPDQHIDNLLLNAMAYNYVLDLDTGMFSRKRAQYTEKNSITMWELFTYDKDTGEIKLGEKAKGKLTKDQIERGFDKFRQAARGIQARIKGTMTQEDKAKWQTNSLMSLIMQYRSWLPNVGREWFGKVRYNYVTDIVEGGRVPAIAEQLDVSAEDFKGASNLVHFVMKKFLPLVGSLAVDAATYGVNKATLGVIPHKEYTELREEYFNKKVEMDFKKFLEKNPRAKNISLQEFKDLKAAQIRATARFVFLMSSFLALIFFLSGDYDGDEEPLYREFWGFRKIYQTLIKARAESMFFVWPPDIMNITKSTIPLMGIPNNIIKIFSNGVDETLDLVEDNFINLPFVESSPQDKTPYFYYTMRLLPGHQVMKQIVEFYEQDEKYLTTRQ